MILDTECTPNCWTEEIDTANNKQIILHKQTNLKFIIQFYPNTNDLLFEIWQGGRMLGANRCWAPNIQAWKEDFIYKAGFNTFLSQQDLKIY